MVWCGMVIMVSYCNYGMVSYGNYGNSDMVMFDILHKAQKIPTLYDAYEYVLITHAIIHTYIYIEI